MNTTIAAISTAVSASGIGIIRISGPEAMDVISRIYRSKGGKKKIAERPAAGAEQPGKGDDSGRSEH